MGDFRITIKAVGGHGCQRTVKSGGQLADSCGSPSCPDCIARRCVAQLMATGCYVSEATLQHWPAEHPGSTAGPRDDLLTGVRSGEFAEATTEHERQARLELRARRMYEAYTASSGGKNYRGEDCPEWDDLPPAIRTHWVAAAR